MAEGVAVQVIGNSTLAVDTFFFLGGFLSSYLYLKGKQNEKEGKPINYRRKVNAFAGVVLRRFLR